MLRCAPRSVGCGRIRSICGAAPGRDEPRGTYTGADAFSSTDGRCAACTGAKQAQKRAVFFSVVGKSAPSKPNAKMPEGNFFFFFPVFHQGGGLPQGEASSTQGCSRASRSSRWIVEERRERNRTSSHSGALGPSRRTRGGQEASPNKLAPKPGRERRGREERGTAAWEVREAGPRGTGARAAQRRTDAAAPGGGRRAQHHGADGERGRGDGRRRRPEPRAAGAAWAPTLTAAPTTRSGAPAAFGDAAPASDAAPAAPTGGAAIAAPLAALGRGAW